MGVRMLDAAAVRDAVAPSALVDALETAFRADDPSDAPLRTVLETDRGRLLLMPAWGAAGVGVKLVTLTPDNPAVGRAVHRRALRPVRSGTQQPVAVLDGAELTARRTAAVSASPHDTSPAPTRTGWSSSARACRPARTSRRCAPCARSTRWS